MANFNTKKDIEVYAHWQSFIEPVKMGILAVTQTRGKETFSFAYTDNWLKAGFSQVIDPDLALFKGSFYPKDEKQNFGIFLDSSPDRWGRVLMQRREAALAKIEDRKSQRLLESDFLLGVFDGHRMGALRFKSEEGGPFLNNNKEMAAPPWTSLRELELASMKFEEDNLDDTEYFRWINMLFAPGSSLGGARPKASIIDKENNLWIAKFPSKNDDKDVAAWEMVANELAQKAGINMAKGMVQKFNNNFNTYLTKRFDRTSNGNRIHFASAMTLLGHYDGEGSEGASYLELMEFISKHGVEIDKELEELWRRIVFSICVKNTDDHLRNHGFLLSDSGWILSPAYDINPNEYGKELSLNISENDNSLDLDLALSIAEHFRLNKKKANEIIGEVKRAVFAWREIAKKYKINKAELERMSVAFSLE